MQQLFRPTIFFRRQCEGAFLATWWVVGLCVYLVFTFAFRTTSFSSAVLNWNFDPTEPFAMLYAPNHVHKFNACVLLVGAVWSVFGVICAFLLPPQDDFRKLFSAIINYAISTFVIYPAELYVLHWILIPLREDLNDLMNRSVGRLPKRGSLSCCAVVVFEESVCVEQGTSRECAVCLDEFQDGLHVRRTPCGHFFHEECLQGWFRQGSFCPLCRVSMGAFSRSRTEVLLTSNE